jgi:hypothetical protein
MDTQGAAKARPFAEPYLASFPTVVDADNLLGQSFGFKAIPNGVLVSPEGKVDATVAGRFEIRQPETRDLLERWLATEEVPLAEDSQDLAWSDEALRLFRDAGAAVRRGDREEAIKLLKLAYPLEPDNYIIRKQLWAIEHPEKFYADEIDYTWQREQLAQGL